MKKLRHCHPMYFKPFKLQFLVAVGPLARDVLRQRGIYLVMTDSLMTNFSSLHSVQYCCIMLIVIFREIRTGWLLEERELILYSRNTWTMCEAYWSSIWICVKIFE